MGHRVAPQRRTRVNLPTPYQTRITLSREVRPMTRRIALIALAAAAVAACSQDRGITGPAAALLRELSASAASAGAADDAPGAVYTLMNLTSGNAVKIFARAADGTLTEVGTDTTGGKGTGSSL